MENPLRKWLKASGVTVSELSDRVNASSAHTWAVCNGNRRVGAALGAEIEYETGGAVTTDGLLKWHAKHGKPRCDVKGKA